MKMLTKTNRYTCPYGYKCCDYDSRKHKQIRRTARRIEKQKWKREAND